MIVPSTILIFSIIITQCDYSNITERAVETTKHSTTNIPNVTDIKSQGSSFNNRAQRIIIIGIVLIVLFIIIIFLLIIVWMYIKQNSRKIKHRSQISHISSIEHTNQSINVTDNEEDDDDIELPKMHTLSQQPGKYGSNRNSSALPSRHVTPDGYSSVGKFNLDGNKNQNHQQKNIQSVIPENQPIMQYNVNNDTPNGVTPYQTSEGGNRQEAGGNIAEIPNLYGIQDNGDDEESVESTTSSDEMYDNPDEMSNDRVLALDNKHAVQIGHVANSSII